MDKGFCHACILYIYIYIYTRHRDVLHKEFPVCQNISLWNSIVNYYFCLWVTLGVVSSVEQGLMELRKLGIEHRLWEASRKEIDQDSSTSIPRKSSVHWRPQPNRHRHRLFKYLYYFLHLVIAFLPNHRLTWENFLISSWIVRGLSYQKGLGKIKVEWSL